MKINGVDKAAGQYSHAVDPFQTQLSVLKAHEHEHTNQPLKVL